MVLKNKKTYGSLIHYLQYVPGIYIYIEEFSADDL